MLDPVQPREFENGLFIELLLVFAWFKASLGPSQLVVGFELSLPVSDLNFVLLAAL